MFYKKRKVPVSGIIPKNNERNEKAEEVKHHLKDMCKIVSIDYINNSSVNPKKHLNNSKLHLRWLAWLD